MVVFLTACSHQAPSSYPTDKVVVASATDSKLTCLQLEKNIQKTQAETQDILEIQSERRQQKWLASSMSNMTLALLSPASANNRIMDKQDFSNLELERLNGLKQRHHYLLTLANEKKCTFSKAIEAKMNSVSVETLNQNFRTRNHY